MRLASISCFPSDVSPTNEANKQQTVHGVVVDAASSLCIVSVRFCCGWTFYQWIWTNNFFFRPTPLGFRQVVQHARLHVAYWLIHLINAVTSSIFIERGLQKLNWHRTSTQCNEPSLCRRKNKENSKTTTTHKQKRQDKVNGWPVPLVIRKKGDNIVSSIVLVWRKNKYKRAPKHKHRHTREWIWTNNNLVRTCLGCSLAVQWNLWRWLFQHLRFSDRFVTLWKLEFWMELFAGSPEFENISFAVQFWSWGTDCFSSSRLDPSCRVPSQQETLQAGRQQLKAVAQAKVPNGLLHIVRFWLGDDAASLGVFKVSNLLLHIFETLPTMVNSGHLWSKEV